MYLLVQPNGAKYWRLKYRYTGKEKLLALGVFPDVGVAEANEKRAAAKAELKAQRDPSVVRKTEKHLATLRSGNTFEAIAQEWVDQKEHGWTPDQGAAGLVRA